MTGSRGRFEPVMPVPAGKGLPLHSVTVLGRCEEAGARDGEATGGVLGKTQLIRRLTRPSVKRIEDRPSTEQRGHCPRQRPHLAVRAEADAARIDVNCTCRSNPRPSEPARSSGEASRIQASGGCGRVGSISIGVQPHKTCAARGQNRAQQSSGRGTREAVRGTTQCFGGRQHASVGEW